MIWPTQEQFDQAHEFGSGRALDEINSGNEAERESPLSGEWEGDTTVRSIARSVGFNEPDEPEGDDIEQWQNGCQELADAWERGYFDTWAHS